MATTQLQFETLFYGAFGVTLHEEGFTIDDSPAATKNGHVITLPTVDDRAIEWQMDGEHLMPFTILGKDTYGIRRKQENLAKLRAAVA